MIKYVVSTLLASKQPDNYHNSKSWALTNGILQWFPKVDVLCQDGGFIKTRSECLLELPVQRSNSWLLGWFHTAGNNISVVSLSYEPIPVCD